MIAAGVFDEDEHLELLEGVIVAMTPQSPAHARCIRRMTRLLTRKLGDECELAVQLPLTLGGRNEPEPDLAVVRADAVPNDQHPATAVLVIEVARDSLRKDRQVKANVYARSGITEYWIVKLEESLVKVLSDPDAVTGAYRRARTAAAAETLTSETLPGLSFAAAEICG